MRIFIIASTLLKVCAAFNNAKTCSFVFDAAVRLPHLDTFGTTMLERNAQVVHAITHHQGLIGSAPPWIQSAALRHLSDVLVRGDSFGHDLMHAYRDWMYTCAEFLP